MYLQPNAFIAHAKHERLCINEITVSIDMVVDMAPVIEDLIEIHKLTRLHSYTCIEFGIFMKWRFAYELKADRDLAACAIQAAAIYGDDDIKMYAPMARLLEKTIDQRGSACVCPFSRK